MECPYKIPLRYFLAGNQKYCVCDDNNSPLFNCLTKEQADYIVQAINSHEKLVEALKENYEYTKYAGANKRINTIEYMDEFFTRGLSAQQVAEQALKEAKS